MRFKYKVFGQDTHINEGVMDAINKDEVISRLQKDGNIIISVDESSAQIEMRISPDSHSRVVEMHYLPASACDSNANCRVDLTWRTGNSRSCWE